LWTIIIDDVPTCRLAGVVHIARLLWSASPIRAIGEAIVLEVALLAVLLANTSDKALIAFTFAWLGIICVLVCALRARLAEARPVRSLAQELGLTLTLTFALQGTLLVVSRQSPLDLAASVGTTWIGYLSLFVTPPVVFFPLRIAAYLWRVWNITRRKRMLWAIAHAHLLTTLVIASLIALQEAVRVTRAPFPVLVPDTSANLLIALMTATIPVVFFLIVAIPLVIGVMILGGLMSYMIARPMTRRIETLARLTGSLRAGNYNERIAVEGEDEIAQLQTDFNAMAETLERTLSELKTERDTVSGLLHTRRELIAGVSHELRTPVATLRGYLESARANWQDAPPPTLPHDLEVMEREVIRLQGLIDDLFTLSRAEVGRLTLRCAPTDVGGLVRGVVDTAAPLAWQSGRVQVAADVATDLPEAIADAGRLEQVLHNLVHNAVRHTPPGGIVAVVVRADSEVSIEVRDTGEGIPLDELPHIWERFYRGGKSDEHSAGLGLALVKELTEAMGGTVSVESAPGQGSRFRVGLRRAILPHP
jgi:signal transduction histidine kinase